MAEVTKLQQAMVNKAQTILVEAPHVLPLVPPTLARRDTHRLAFWGSIALYRVPENL